MKENGFTLLELLVSLSIFAVMSSFAYGGLTAMIQTREQVSAEMESLAQLQGVFNLLGRDVEQMVDRSIRDGYEDVHPALSWNGDAAMGLEFTRNGYRNPIGLTRSSLQRVAYRLRDDTLMRDSWSVLDRGPDSKPFGRRIMTGVNAFDVRFIDVNNVAHKVWPPAMEETLGSMPMHLPKALDISIDSRQWGRINRLYLVAGAT